MLFFFVQGKYPATLRGEGGQGFFFKGRTMSENCKSYGFNWKNSSHFAPVI
jgi:hypothetical protein